MAENEDPKGKINSQADARPVVPNSSAIKKASESGVKSAEAKSTEAKQAEASQGQVKPADGKVAAAKTVAPVDVAASAPMKPDAPKTGSAPQLPVAKAAETKSPDATALGGRPLGARLPEFKESGAALETGAPKALNVKGKPGPKPKIKTAPANAPAKPEPVQTVVPAKAIEPEPEAKVAKDVKSAVEPAQAPKAVNPNAAQKTALNDKPAFAGLFNPFTLEETTMTNDFNGFQSAMTDAQAKAKAAFDKGTSVLGEVSEFAKGNIEAAVESGKIWAEGVQGLGSEFVSESRVAFETMTGDIKELAAAKSPTDFFKLHSDLMRKNFDTAVAYGSKNSEAMLKLVSDTFAPISGRVSVAVEKTRSTSSF